MEFDYRIQKIGDSYMGFKRTSTNWKANTGSFMLEELDLTDQQKMWADECGKLFGGMDILALDVIRTKSGEDYIIELNDSLIGFPQEYQQQCLEDIRDITIRRMNEYFS